MYNGHVQVVPLSLSVAKYYNSHNWSQRDSIYWTDGYTSVPTINGITEIPQVAYCVWMERVWMYIRSILNEDPI